MPYTDPIKKKEYEQRRLIHLRERRLNDPEFRDRERARSRKWYENKYKVDPEYKAYKNKYRSVSRYGISVAEYTDMLIKQEYKCIICSTKHEESKGKQLVIDHNHATHIGDIRGLLCNTCNLGLGMFKDNPDFLKNAAKYLEQ